jgi:hypothetical protein
MAGEKHAYIQSSFVHKAEHFYERTQNGTTGKVTTQETNLPHITTSKTTLTENLAQNDCKESVRQADQGHLAAKLALKKPGYDASQL